MIVVNVEQGTPEWFAARLGRPTGSVYSDVLAKGKDGGKSLTRQKLIVKLAKEVSSGRPSASTFKSQAMQDGTDREPLARRAYEVLRGVLVEEVGFCQHDTIFTGVSPDGLVGDDGMVEIKCPTDITHREYMRLEAGKCPTEYRAQIQGQLWVTGRQWCDFVSYHPEFPDNAQLVIRRVQRDEDYISALERSVVEFNKEVAEEAEAIASYREAA